MCFIYMFYQLTLFLHFRGNLYVRHYETMKMSK